MMRGASASTKQLMTGIDYDHLGSVHLPPDEARLALLEKGGAAFLIILGFARLRLQFRLHRQLLLQRMMATDIDRMLDEGDRRRRHLGKALGQGFGLAREIGIRYGFP